MEDSEKATKEAYTEDKLADVVYQCNIQYVGLRAEIL